MRQSRFYQYKVGRRKNALLLVSLPRIGFDCLALRRALGRYLRQRLFILAQSLVVNLNDARDTLRACLKVQTQRTLDRDAPVAELVILKNLAKLVCFKVEIEIRDVPYLIRLALVHIAKLFAFVAQAA